MGIDMEIEKKYLINELPKTLGKYEYIDMEQGYISVNPVIRIRKAGERYILTVKSKGLLVRQEFEMDISEEEYNSLSKKVEGNIIAKRRYLIPLKDTEGTTGDKDMDQSLKIELDVFNGLFKGLIYAEVEFPTEEAAKSFIPPAWFYKDVTSSATYQNSSLSSMKEKDITNLIKNGGI